MIPTRILFCTDFSENSEPAAQCALEYSKVFDAALTIIHVVDSWAGLPQYEHGLPLIMEEVSHDIEKTANTKLQSMAEKFGSEINEVKTRVAIGVPAEEIFNAAREESADLIIMGTHGWTGFRHMLLGSVAEKVLRMAQCPVLVVKSQSEGTT
jgi:universal stress protein A